MSNLNSYSKGSKFLMVGVVLGIVLGGMVLNNLFTFWTNEYPNPGPGFGTSLRLKADMTVILNTVEPGRFLSPIESIIFPLTGKAWAEPDGTTSILWTQHAGVATTIGLNWIEDQLWDSPSTTPAQYISLSTSASSPSSAWTQIPTEIADGNGLARAIGSYTSTGDGSCTVAKQFTASGTYTSVQLSGLQYGSSGDNNLLTSDTFTPVTLGSGDKLTITWTLSIS